MRLRRAVDPSLISMFNSLSMKAKAGGDTKQIFTTPRRRRTEDYITGRFG